jgi:hypothetical protein
MNLPTPMTLDSGSIHIRGDPAESTRRSNPIAFKPRLRKASPLGSTAPRLKTLRPDETVHTQRPDDPLRMPGPGPKPVD